MGDFQSYLDKALKKLDINESQKTDEEIFNILEKVLPSYNKKRKALEENMDDKAL